MERTAGTASLCLPTRPSHKRGLEIRQAMTNLLQYYYSHVDWHAGSDADWEAWRPNKVAELRHPQRPSSARQARGQSRPVMGARFSNWYHAAMDDFEAKKHVNQRVLEDMQQQKGGRSARGKKISREDFLAWYDDALKMKSRNFRKLKDKYTSQDVARMRRRPKPVSKAHFEIWYADAVKRYEQEHKAGIEESTADESCADTSTASYVRNGQAAPVFNASHFNDWVELQTRKLNELHSVAQ